MISAENFIASFDNQNHEAKYNRFLSMYGLKPIVPDVYSWPCPRCGERFETAEAAIECFNRGAAPTPWRPGDLLILLGRGLPTWRGVEDADPWRAFVLPGDPDLSPTRESTCVPWYVVVGLQDVGHETRPAIVSLMHGEISAGYLPKNTLSPIMINTDAGLIIEPNNPYWENRLAALPPIPPPSEALKCEAAALAAHGFRCEFSF